jgi:hypothetical protein
LAIFGERALRPELPLLLHALYWGLFLVLLVVALYMVLLDVRYIRLQYLLARREIFQETLGDPTFRSALRDAEETPLPPRTPPDGECG